MLDVPGRAEILVSLAIIAPALAAALSRSWEQLGAVAALGLVIGCFALREIRHQMEAARREGVSVAAADGTHHRVEIAEERDGVHQRWRRQAEDALDTLRGKAEADSAAEAREALSGTAEALSCAAMRVVTEATGASVATEDVRHDLVAVMDASREFLETISQIGAHAASSAGMGVSAFRKAEATTTNVDELLVASQRIGEMTGLVASIARQTNMLALNATIEAARAGEHGRGFAVVAAEVKVLAGESAKAAASIADMATQIYGSTERAIGSIRAISEAIGSLNEATNAIATAVDERVQAAASMTGSVERVASNIGHVASAIARIEAAADETLQGAGFLRRGTTDLATRIEATEMRAGQCADMLAALVAPEQRPPAESLRRDRVLPGALTLSHA